MKRSIPLVTVFAFAAAAQAAVCLQDVFAPEVTGVPPTFAHREMCRTDDGEIRHYGQVMRGGKVCRVYAASRDEGLSWRLFPAAADDVGALVKSPWSGEWLTVCVRDGVQSVRSKKGPSGGDAVLTSVTAPGFVFFRQPQPLAERGHWLCAGAAIDQDPTARPGSQRPAVLLSGDDGRTWRMVVISNVVTQASERTAPDAIPRWENYCCEPTVDQRRDGTLQMFVRTSTDHNWRYLSRDGGETWTGPERLPHFFACNTMPTLLRLKDGRLIYFWNNTVPLPKLPSQTGQALAADEANGRWETVFTNRDVLHAAISEDDGETWIGFREIRLNEHRNDVDYRELGNDPAQELDKSVHQSQAMELPGGKVLLAAGQNSAVRRFIVFDPAWLYETERHEDFRRGLGNVCHFLYVKGPVGGARGWAGHCTWNRVPGARMVLDPDLPANQREVVKLVRRRDNDLVSDLPGLVWNFPAACEGRVEVECRVVAGSEGFRFALSDHWSNPCDRYASEHAAASWEVRDVPADRWVTVAAEWSGEKVVFSVDGRKVAERRMSDPPRFGLSYVHLQLLSRNEDPKGVLFRGLHKLNGLARLVDTGEWQAAEESQATPSLYSLRFSAYMSDGGRIWADILKMLDDHPGAVDEVWFSTGTCLPPLSWHRAQAARQAAAAAELRRRGIAPSLQIHATIGHSDSISMGGSSGGDCSAKDWRGWTGPDGKEARYCSCPRDPKFVAYFIEIAKIYASYRPPSVWFDDDLRIQGHAPASPWELPRERYGCWCDRCLADFSASEGTRYDRASLQKAMEGDPKLVDRWERFQYRSLAEFVTAFVEAFHALSPETTFGYQHCPYWNDAQSAVYRAMRKASGGNAIGSRPGGGFYFDHNPYDQLEKAYCAAREFGMIGMPDIEVVCPEIETCPRTFSCRTGQGVLLEALESLSMGMNSISLYIMNCQEETPDFFGRRFLRPLAAHRRFFLDYIVHNRGALPSGLKMKATKVGDRLLGLQLSCGIPMVEGFAHVCGELDMKGIDATAISSPKLMKLYERADKASNGTLAAIPLDPVQGWVLPRTFGDGTLRSVTFVNTTIDRSEPFRLKLRGVPSSVDRATWRALGGDCTECPVLRQDGIVSVEVPAVGPWNGGWLQIGEGDVK